MPHKDIAQQTIVEHEVLDHVMASLRSIVDWQVANTGAARKISSLCFVAQALQRHLVRLMDLEEHDGYMSMVTSANPALTETVGALCAEHETFRSEIDQVVSRLERLAPDESTLLDNISEQLLSLLDDVNHHGGEEIRLIQQALLQDEGGEA